MPENELKESFEIDDDYYALLNLSKDASEDEITNSYRTLSKLYHPDKHTDPVKKKQAEVLFNKIKVAYEVLRNQRKRAIYDTLGTKGLEAEGWQVVSRNKTPQEIREEYELLVKEKEERLLQQQTNPKGNVLVNVNATDLFDFYDDEFRVPTIEISGMSIGQSVEVPLSLTERLTLNGSLYMKKGVGSGKLGCSMKKVFSDKTWVEGSVGGGDGMDFSFRAFRLISRYSVGTMYTNFHFKNGACTPGVELMVTRQLTKKTSGFILWKMGTNPSLQTTFIRAHEKGLFNMGFVISAKTSFIDLTYIRQTENVGKLKVSLKFGTFGGILSYGCEKKVSRYNTVTATMIIAAPGGVVLRLKLSRANQSYAMPIQLSDEIIPSAVFYGTVTPIVGWYIIKKLILDPYSERQRRKQLEKTKEANAEKLAEKRKEALIAVSLMQETYHRIKAEEDKKHGLVISKAYYGSSENIANIGDLDAESNLEILNVTVQLQCLVKASRLNLPERMKSNLPGFFDPCMGEDKSLYIEYLYRKKTHAITIKDNETLRIPTFMDS